MIVVDSSALIWSLVHQGDLGERVRSVLSMHTRWIAPAHLSAEFGHAIRGMSFGGKIEPQKAEWALSEYLDLGIELIAPDSTAFNRAWQLRQNLSFYDALYVNLAEQNEVQLLTSDARISASGTARCEILTVVGDS